MSLTQDAVVTAAVDLLDEVGLDGLSLRALARRLGVSAPTLYWHVDDKQHLLDLMADAIMSERDIPAWPGPGQAWWAWLADTAVSARQAMLAHRDGARVVAGNRPTPQSLGRIEERLAALVAAGFRPPKALDVVLTLGDFVMGSVLETQANAARTPAEHRDDQLREELASERYRTLAAVFAAYHHDPDRLFLDGLRWMLTGLRLEHAELHGEQLDVGWAAAQVREAVAG